MRIFILILFFSQFVCCRENKHKNLASTNNIENNNVSLPSKVSKQKYGDTLKVLPDSFRIKIPIFYNKIEHSINLVCNRDSASTNISSTTSDLSLPKNFYNILEDDFALATWLMNPDYKEAFLIYQKNNFEGTNLIKYSKFHSLSNLLIVVDLNDDGYDDILLLNLQESSSDNQVYELFLGNSNEGFFYKQNFFNNKAFYGWDKTGKYIITGTSDTQERKLSKNKIVHGKLVSIAKCNEYTNSNKSCW